MTDSSAAGIYPAPPTSKSTSAAGNCKFQQGSRRAHQAVFDCCAGRQGMIEHGD
jgi:hypothetical protein